MRKGVCPENKMKKGTYKPITDTGENNMVTINDNKLVHIANRLSFVAGQIDKKNADTLKEIVEELKELRGW